MSIIHHWSQRNRLDFLGPLRMQSVPEELLQSWPLVAMTIRSHRARVEAIINEDNPNPPESHKHPRDRILKI